MHRLKFSWTAWRRWSGISLAVFWLACGPAAFCDESDRTPNSSQAQEQRHFTLKVLPLLTEKCLACHGGDPDDIKGEFDVRTLEAILRGGESEEAALIPGNVDESPLVQAVRWESYEMPPKENDRLTPEQVTIIERWVKNGAVWPDEKVQQAIRRDEWSVQENEDGILMSTSGGLADEWTYRRYDRSEVWAFQPVLDSFEFDSIDQFIDAGLEAAELEAADEAEPRHLLRRAFLDLTGLPPTPRQTRDFLKSWEEDSEAAWSQLVDDLLQSPHYGERWAQHWLDVVRYADTAGFSNDYERSNAWRYRDYVVRAFNEDKPYDQFVTEQIAGDELRPDDPEAVVATGFLRMGPWGTAMIPTEEARQLYLDDVVHGVGQSFMSMPLRCCKCHDHKFDPIPTRDYYRIYASFAATQPAEVPAEFLAEENLSGFDEGKQLVEALHQFADDKRLELVNKREAAAKQWYLENSLPYKDDAARKKDPEDMKPVRHVGLSEMEQGRLKVREQDEWIWKRRKERYQPLAQSVYNGPDRNVNARRLRRPDEVDQSWRPVSYVHTGGDYQAKGVEVTPGVLSGCGLPSAGGSGEDPYALPTDLDGRRLALAQWMTDPSHPLTARSFVNRVWQYHFGQGIVKTSNNFGAKGDKPSHPELLDWLARDFVENGWRVKRLHKLVMMSAAYRRSTQHDDLESLDRVDPNNRLLARFVPRRLTAEELRDCLLATSGELNRELGGVPIMPEINMEVALQPRMIQFSIAPAHQPSRTPTQRNRRSLYAYRVRGQADPFLEVMNQPNPNDSCEMRDTAAVSPQAFTLLNSDVMTDRSIALALRLQKDAKRVPAQIGRAFRLVFGRGPTQAERDSLRKYVDEMVGYHQQHQPDPTNYPTFITRSLVEEFSGKVFEYQEWLAVFEAYEADAKPDSVSPETRALADMCLLLFNSNEFVYVY